MKKRSFVLKATLLAMAVGIAYNVSPTIYALSPLLIPINVKFLFESKSLLEQEKTIVIGAEVDPDTQEAVITLEDKRDGEKKHLVIKREHHSLPLHALRKINNDEKAAFLLEIKKLLEAEIEAGSYTEESKEWIVRLDEVIQILEQQSATEKLEQVQQQLNNEISLGIINQEQAEQVLVNIQNGSYEQELESLKAEILSEQEKIDEINDFQESLVSAVKNGNINATQADEILVNLENGVLDVEEGGIVFDLSKELSS